MVDLAANALMTIDEARRSLMIEGAAVDDRILDSINEMSDTIEREYRGALITPSTKVDGVWQNYFTGYFRAGTPNDDFGGLACDLFTLDFPVVAVVAIYEAGTLLVANTDYQVLTKPASLIRRVVSGQPAAWPQNTTSSTYRQIEVRYVAGYRKHDDLDTVSVPRVPEHIMRVARDHLAWIYQYKKSKAQGFSSVTDGLGSRTFSGPPFLTDQMKAQIGGAARAVARRLSGEERA